MKTLITTTKRKLSHSALPLYFPRIECHGALMETKHEKEKKKRQSSLLVYLALQLKGLEVK